MIISFVVAMDKKRLIGSGNALPWRLPKDVKRFRDVTMGHPVIMGRKTYESIPIKFRPLPGRHNIVLTGNRDYSPGGCTVVHSMDEALAAAGDVDEVMIGGGAELYAQLLSKVHRIYLTTVDGTFDGDVYFPEIDWAGWTEVHREEHPADAENPFDTTYLILSRKGNPG
jgi:dihydrofolate reductase